MKNFLIITAILLLITAFADLHVGYGYYQLLRWCVTICSGLMAISFKDKDIFLFITFCIIAVLFNPIVPIYFDKYLWKIIDGITGVFFIGVHLYKK